MEFSFFMVPEFEYIQKLYQQSSISFKTSPTPDPHTILPDTPRPQSIP